LTVIAEKNEFGEDIIEDNTNVDGGDVLKKVIENGGNVNPILIDQMA